MERPKAKHGGARPGAGRPKGSRNALPTGSIRALVSAAAARRRLGKDADPDALKALEATYERVADVLDETVPFQAAPSVLKAAGMVAEAIAGPVKQQVEISGKVTLEQLVAASMPKKGGDAA